MDIEVLIALLQEMPKGTRVMLVSLEADEAYDIEDVKYDEENECVTLSF